PSRLTPLPFSHRSAHHRDLHSFPTRRSSDLSSARGRRRSSPPRPPIGFARPRGKLSAPERHTATWSGKTTSSGCTPSASAARTRSEEHTSELQSHLNLVCRLLLEKKKNMMNR